jgi:O-antigen/teichoic acid export membrane protein
MGFDDILGRIKKRLSGLSLRTFAKNAAVYSFGTLSAQCIGMIIVPVVSRLYGTTAFGILSVFVSLIGVLAPIACLRLDFAVPLPINRRVAMALVLGACLGGVALSAFFSAVAFGIAGPFSGTTFGPISPYLWWALGLALPAQAFQLVLTGWNVRESEFKILAISQIASAIVGCIGQLIFGLLDTGPSGLIAGITLGWWASVIVQSRTVVKTLHNNFRTSLRLMGRATLTYRQFLIWTLPSSVINTLGYQIIPIVVVANYGVTNGGLYFLADRIVALPLGLIGTGLGRVMWGEIARLSRSAPEKLQPLFWSVSIALLIAISPGLLVLPFGREIFAFVLGAQWAESGTLAAILFFSGWTGLIANTVSRLPILGYNHWQTGWEVVRLLTTTAIAGLATIWRIPFEQFVLAITVGLSASYIVLFALNAIAINRTERGRPSLLTTPPR